MAGLPATGRGQSSVPVVETAARLDVAAVGFGGRVRLGAWTPVWIDVTAGSDVDGTVRIDAPTPTGQPVVQYGADVRAAAGARVRVFVPAIFFDSRTPGTVYLEVGGRRVASRPLPRLHPAEEIVAVLSSEPLGAEAAALRVGRLEVAYVSAETLPPVWQAYEAVRLLVVRTLDERRLDDAQRMAIRDWVWTGGRVLMMPDGDDTRHFAGATLSPLRGRAADRVGYGQVIVWTRDAADPLVRGDPASGRAWDTVLGGGAASPAPSLEAAVPAGRPVPLRVHLVVGALVLVYVLVVRRASRFLALLRPVSLVVFVVLVTLASTGAARLSTLARRDASGVVTAMSIDVLPGTGYAVLRVHGRAVSSHGGSFSISAPAGLMMRPFPPAAVSITHGPVVRLSGRGTGLQIMGAAVVPAAIAGTYHVTGNAAVVAVSNRSGHRLESPWVYVEGRAQPVVPIGESAQLTLEEPRWQPADRLQRTEPNHALLVWTFSRLGSDAILRGTRAWLVGWWRDPALALAWDGHAQAPLQLVLVPLAVTR